MAFDYRQFSLLVGANGMSFWHYRSTVDNLAAIRTANYFNPVAGQINTGDLLYIGPDSTGAAGGFDMLINTAGNITVAAPTLTMTGTLPKGAAGTTGPTK